MPNHITNPLLHFFYWAPWLSLSHRGHLVLHLFINAWRWGERVTHTQLPVSSHSHLSVVKSMTIHYGCPLTMGAREGGQEGCVCACVRETGCEEDKEKERPQSNSLV